MEERDALFVINKDVILTDLHELCHKEHIRSALLLTTHRIFPNEEDMLHQIGDNIKIVSFSDLLTEEDMCRCDETATHVLLNNAGCVTVDYNSRFISISLSEKNRIVHKNLIATQNINKIFYMPGLGVSEAYWGKIGTSLSSVKQTLETKNLSKKVIQIFLNPLLKAESLAKNDLLPASKYVIRNNGKTYIFLSPLKRLRIRAGIPVKKVKFLFDQPDRDNVYCMPIHGYNQILAEKLGGVSIFVDGYHPSNYPRSYIDSYGKNDVFVVRTMIDERWFSAYGRKTMKPPPFVESELFSSCIKNSFNRVLIALNHAGDWTALINRSDTDELVLAAAEMARNLPEVTFRIRTHPTMNHPAHEGLHSASRIDRFVRSVGLTNLHISTYSLAEDLEWADICLSEYSQVLLDALRNGKLGIAINLTKRRSFMQDYADLGFFHAQNLDGTIETLQYINEAPKEASIQQNKAVKSYNDMLKKWLGENQV